MLLPRLLQARREDIQRADPKTNTCIYIYICMVYSCLFTHHSLQLQAPSETNSEFLFWGRPCYLEGVIDD